MTIKLTNDVKGTISRLLSSIPKITGAELTASAINAWIDDLSKAGNDPEKVANAWLSILAAINANYCYGKFTAAKYDLYGRINEPLHDRITNPLNYLNDPRSDVAVIIKACLDVLMKVPALQNQQAFIEQVATLLVVKANLAYCYPSGHPMAYCAFLENLQAAKEFIDKYNLLYTEAHSAWCYLKNAGEHQSYTIVAERIAAAKTRLQELRNELAIASDDNVKAALSKSIRSISNELTVDEDMLKEYSRAYWSTLGSAYYVTVRRALTNQYVVGSLAVAAVAATGYTMQRRPKCRI